MQLEQRVCDDAPFYVLGPLVTDVFLATITSPAPSARRSSPSRRRDAVLRHPKEHVGLPRAEDVKPACIAYKIAAHAGDIARGIAAAREWDDDLSRARAASIGRSSSSSHSTRDGTRAPRRRSRGRHRVLCDVRARLVQPADLERDHREFARAARRRVFNPNAPPCAAPASARKDGALCASGAALPIVEGKHACHSDLGERGRPCAGPPGRALAHAGSNTCSKLQTLLSCPEFRRWLSTSDRRMPRPRPRW